MVTIVHWCTNTAVTRWYDENLRLRILIIEQTLFLTTGMQYRFFNTPRLCQTLPQVSLKYERPPVLTSTVALLEVALWFRCIMSLSYLPWSLKATWHSTLWGGTLPFAENQTSNYPSQLVPLPRLQCRHLFIFFATKTQEKLSESWRKASPWTGYSQWDEAISRVVCRNRFPSVYLCEDWNNFAIKY